MMCSSLFSESELTATDSSSFSSAEPLCIKAQQHGHRNQDTRLMIGQASVRQAESHLLHSRYCHLSKEAKAPKVLPHHSCWYRLGELHVSVIMHTPAANKCISVGLSVGRLIRVRYGGMDLWQFGLGQQSPLKA
ncbi:unnamed protein product [Pleuronectes platessa]|uniref:Uncharacterized protein n=1 Tax=Pleuronectes platessa TaxID=8262 RepID=A0A9N7TIZ9_PLEPL|nr:unnamed protein product [Pleuronectes platessa]